MNFNDQFTIIPDTGETQLHCSKCPGDQAFTVGYHPSLDRVNEAAITHNQREHNDLRPVS